MPRRVLLLLLAAATLLAACSGGDSDDDGAAPTTTVGEAGSTTVPADEAEGPTTTLAEPVFTGEHGVALHESECSFAVPVGTAPACYRLVVPEDWSDPDGGTSLRLAVAVFEGGDGPPTVYLEGGPGSSAFAFLGEAYSTAFAPLVEGGDLIVLDQRGVGQSEPALECPEVRIAELALAAAEGSGGRIPSLADAAATCQERLVGEGVDLVQYNSVASAADLDALRTALGHDQWNVLGVSYGARLAQTYARDFPDGVRALVLDSAYGLDDDPSASGDEPAAVDLLFSRCAADATCEAAYPDLAARYDALVQALDDEPIAFEVNDPEAEANLPLVADGELLSDTVVNALSTREAMATVPRLIAELEEGQTAILAILTELDMIADGAVSIGQHLSVVCNEEAPFGDAAAQAELYAATCSGWEAGQAPAAENEPVTTAVPTLVLGGEFDPITPASGGADLAAALPATFVEVPNVGHGLLGEPCANSVVRAFLADPTATVDSTCTATVAPPAFVPGAIGPVTMEDFQMEFRGVTLAGVRPEGWRTVARAGGFIRFRDVLDPTGVFAFGLPGLAMSDFVAAISGTENFDLNVTEEEDLVVGERSWQRYDATDGKTTVTMVGDTESDPGIFVVLEALSEEREALIEEVLVPFLQEIALQS
jgi:pimeloyl-ACP methyl ester carboxylesterase